MKMTGSMESSFKKALKKPPSLRTAEDLHTIYCHLYHMDVLSHLREHQLRSMCTSARYEKHEANHVLFYRRWSALTVRFTGRVRDCIEDRYNCKNSFLCMIPVQSTVQ
ncbi:rap guanine nucleotide exchange factor 6-like [Pholidichthys leucotaenia]